ncbi:MAG TPA: hypothetical protein VG435_01625 [Acidimicrobiales bacterium]|jgi:hypothetical protein|nr:hypothetical protein [Acidimicrobiales bacterium]
MATTDGTGRDQINHDRPTGVDDATVAAVGKLSEAVELLERVRGRFFDLHQMVGHLDLQMGEAAEMLQASGHPEAAALVEHQAVGRNVIDGRWTFQLVEEFNEQFYEPIKQVERQITDELMAGRQHVFEAEMKERRRTHGAAGHERRPGSTTDE